MKYLVMISCLVLTGCMDRNSRRVDVYERCIDKKLSPKECSDAAIRLYPMDDGRIP